MSYSNHKLKTKYLVEFKDKSGKETYATVSAKNLDELAHILIDRNIKTPLRIFTESEYAKAIARAIEVENKIKQILAPER